MLELLPMLLRNRCITRRQREPDLEFGAIYKSTVTEIRDNGVMVQLYESMPPALIPNSQLDQRKVQTK